MDEISDGNEKLMFGNQPLGARNYLRRFLFDDKRINERVDLLSGGERARLPVPGKCDHQLQFDFHTREMLPRLEEARLGERKVIFVDAAHFVLGAFLGLIWCFQRIFLKTSPGRQRYNILGAIDSHNQEFTSIRTTKNINTLTIISLLDLINEKYPIILVSLVMDNAPISI